MIYVKHHKACQGWCGYCQQLFRENPGKTIEELKKREEENPTEVGFCWDEASVVL